MAFSLCIYYLSHLDLDGHSCCVCFDSSIRGGQRMVYIGQTGLCGLAGFSSEVTSSGGGGGDVFCCCCHHLSEELSHRL